jgi:hypothetical protein
MKFTKNLASIVFILLIAAGIFVYINFGNLAKNAAERIATNALGVDVDISSMNVSLRDKKAVLSGITIANPPGYRKSHIVTADQMDIALNTASRELVDVNNVSVDGVVVNLEVNEKGINLRDLKKLASQNKQKKSPGSETVRLIVRKMVINTSTLNPSLTLLDKEVASLSVPAVRISGIGTRGNGAVAQDVVSQVLIQYLAAAERQAGQAGYFSASDVVDDVKGAIDDATKDIKKLFE